MTTPRDPHTDPQAGDVLYGRTVLDRWVSEWTGDSVYSESMGMHGRAIACMQSVAGWREWAAAHLMNYKGKA